MIAAVVNGQNCWLLNFMPNNDASVRLGLKLPVDLQRALGGAASRRPEGHLPRYSIEWSADIRMAEFAALRNASQLAQDEPFLAPVWPFTIRVGVDDPVITAGLTLAWTEDFATWEINPADLEDYDYAAPLLYGRLTQPPRLGPANDDLVTVDFSVDEDAPADFSFVPSSGVLPADTTFNTAGGYAAPVFPFVPDWDSPPVPGTAITDAERNRVGPGRRPSSAFYPQTPELTQQADFRFDNVTDAAKLLAWWQRRGGISDSHWIAGTQALGRLSAAAAAGTNVLNFAAPIVLGANVYVALFDPAHTLEFGRVTASASQQITLAANLAHSWGPSLTSVTLAMLARHANDELAIAFERAGASWIASTSLRWREVAPEYAPPAGETRGTTLGRLPGEAWFFQIDLDYNGATQSTYLTNYEAGAVANATTWAYNACDFDSLVQDIDLEDDVMLFRARWFAGCPWENWLPGRLSARGYLTVFRADVDAAGAFSNFAQKWKGELGQPKLNGPDIAATVKGANALFARRGPRQLMSPTCGTNLFRARCGLALEDWTFNAVVAAVAGNSVTIGTITRANAEALPAGFGAVDWFALGWLGWAVGGLPLRGGILSSAELAGGQIVLTLERPPGIANGTSVTVVPGCDRRGDTCRDKFDNYDNFRGFEFMPAVSPSLIIPQRKASPAKK